MVLRGANAMQVSPAGEKSLDGYDVARFIVGWDCGTHGDPPRQGGKTHADHP
jgi:hypothetical protein